MPDIQGTYETTISEAQEGYVADSSLRDAKSCLVEGGDINFGRVVSQGAADSGCVIGGANAIGITITDKTQRGDLYAQNETAAVMRQGSVWVVATEAVNAGDAVAYDPATGELNTSGTALDGAKYETSGAIGELVRVHMK